MANYTWMFDADAFDVEAHYNIDNLTVYVMKVGGGAIGEKYDGAWLYKVYDHSRSTGDKGQFESPYPMTHERVAESVADLYSEEY